MRIIYCVDVEFSEKPKGLLRAFSLQGDSFELDDNGSYKEGWVVGCAVFNNVNELLKAMGLPGVDSSEIEMEFENIRFGHNRYRSFHYVPLSSVEDEDIKELVQLLRAELPPLALYSNAIEVSDDGGFVFDEDFPGKMRYYIDVVVGNNKNLKQVEVIPEFYFNKTRGRVPRSLSTFFQPL